jgi:hypothetical protein
MKMAARVDDCLPVLEAMEISLGASEAKELFIKLVRRFGGKGSEEGL